MREFKHIKVEMTEKKDQKGRYLELSTYLNTYKQSAVLYTIESHIKSMIIGVTTGYRYKMLCVKKHFKISPKVLPETNQVEISNFIGGRHKILVPILPGVTAINHAQNDEGEIWFEGNDKQNVSQNCSLVNQSCNVGVKDKRKFLDGIYISSKGLISKD